MVVVIGVIAVVLFALYYHCGAARLGATHTSSAMQTAKDDSIGGPGITLTPADGSYENVLIWMHGLGDTAAGWAGASK